MSDARRSVLNSLEQRAGPPIRAIVIAPMLHCIWTTVRHHFIAWRETASQANTFKCNGDGLLSIAFWTEAGYRFPHNYTSLLPPTFYHRWRREGNLTIGLLISRKGVDKMLTAILGITTVVCAVCLFFSRVTIKTILYCWRDRGYPLPTDKEIHANTRKVIDEIFRPGRKPKY